MQQQLFETNEKYDLIANNGTSTSIKDIKKIEQLEDELMRLKTNYTNLFQEHSKLESNYQLLDKKTIRKSSRIENLQLLVDAAKDNSGMMHQLVVQYSNT